MTADSDERIARYLDDEMEADERSTFEEQLEADWQLATRLAALREQDSAVRTAIEGLLAGRPLSLPAELARPVATLAEVRRPSRIASILRPGRRWAVPAALAASLAVVVLVSPLVRRATAPVSLQALESVAAGQSVALPDGRQLDAVLTFAASDGDWCREYAISDGTRGIACRRDGAWQSEVELAGASPATGTENPTGYTTAGAAEDAAIERAYARLGAAIPLGAEDEARVMRSGWTAKAN